jgi:hypothetical protein
MKRRGAVFFLTVLFFLSGLYGEEGPLSPEAAEPVPAGEGNSLPLAPFLEVLSVGDVSWRPDWPEDFPPDAFSLHGRALSVTLDSGAGPVTLSRDSEGRLREFPFFLDGAFIQVKADYGPSGALLSLSAESAGKSPAEESVDSPADSSAGSWRFDFPGEASPEGIVPGNDPVRVSRGGTWYFVLFLDTGSALSETWYDGEGNFLAYYKAHIRRDGPRWRIRSLEFRRREEPGREDYDFDSADRITAVSSPRGDFTALYRAGLPRYWERRPAPAGSGPETGPPPDAGSPAPAAPDPAGPPEPPAEGNFVLQWDEAGFLVEKRPAPGETGGINGGVFRYEYERDRRGNWVKRRELEMTDFAGVRVPVFRREITRQILYPGE